MTELFVSVRFGYTQPRPLPNPQPEARTRQRPRALRVFGLGVGLVFGLRAGDWAGDGIGVRYTLIQPSKPARFGLVFGLGFAITRFNRANLTFTYTGNFIRNQSSDFRGSESL